MEERSLTKLEILRYKLRALLKIEDKEQRHIEADKLLLEYIDDPIINKLWEQFGNWYA